MRKVDYCPPDDVAAKLEPIQKMELENEVLVTGEGGKITTITQVEEHYHNHHVHHHHQPLILKARNQHHCDHIVVVQAQLAGAVPVPGAPPLPLILANQIQGSDIMRQVRFLL